MDLKTLIMFFKRLLMDSYYHFNAFCKIWSIFDRFSGNVKNDLFYGKMSN